MKQNELVTLNETITNNVELSYQDNGTLKHILVTATWRRGQREHSGRIIDELIDDSVVAKVEYTIRGETAELTGFYPDTVKTGEKLYRENLKALRVLSHVRDEVITRTDDYIHVEDPQDALFTYMSE